MPERTHASTEEWIKLYYEHCGAKDIDAAMEFWAPEGRLRFANEDPLVGRETIREKFEELTGSWARETHTLLDLWELPGGVVIFELAVAFDRHDGSHVDLYGATVCRVEGRRFLEQRTYVDMTPVFAPASADEGHAG